MILLKIFVSGAIFLGLTIAVNILANTLKLTGWYDFLSGHKPNTISIIWLFVGYPLVLGFFVYLLRNLIK